MTPEFDRFASDYNKLLHDPIRERFAPESRFFCERKWLLLRELQARYGIDTGRASWLDVGCGTGDLLRLGHAYFAQAAGCDVSAEMMNDCGHLAVRKQASPTTLPFADQSFDFITAVCVFHHVPEDGRILLAESIMRVLKPGGLFCIIEHNPWNPVTQLIVKRCPVDVDAHLLTARQARMLIRSIGCKILATRYFLYFSERLFARFKRLEGILGPVPGGGQYAVLGRKPW